MKHTLAILGPFTTTLTSLLPTTEVQVSRAILTALCAGAGGWIAMMANTQMKRRKK